MHCFSLATVGSPHCSLKLAVVLWREKERCEEKDQRKEEIESDQMYGSLLEKVRKDHAHTHTLPSVFQ